MKRTCYIAINMIRTNPGEADGWTDRFVTLINTRLPDGVVKDHSDDAQGHSTWLQRGVRFEGLMQAI